MRPIRHGSRRRPTAVAAAALTTGLVASLSACAGWGAVGQGGGERRHQRPHGQQPPDGRPAAADRRQLHGPDRHPGQLHGPARERRPRQDQPGVLQPGRAVRRRSLSNFEIPIYAKAKWISPLDDFIAKDTAFDQADILEPMTGLALVARARSTASRSTASPRSSCTARTSSRRRASRCPTTRPGRRSPTSRPRSTAPSPAWRASACAASPGGASSSPR